MTFIIVGGKTKSKKNVKFDRVGLGQEVSEIYFEVTTTTALEKLSTSVVIQVRNKFIFSKCESESVGKKRKRT